MSTTITPAAGADVLSPQEHSTEHATMGLEVAASAYGVVANTGADQAPAITAMIASLIASGTPVASIVFPVGDIYFTGPINWSGLGTTVAKFFSATAGMRRPPAIRSSGPDGTRFRMLNAANTNCTGFLFSVTEAEAALGIIELINPKIENCSFYGPGQSVQQTTLAADATAGTAISLTDAVAQNGDAIALINGARRHWATVLSGGGTTSIVIDTRQAILSTFAAASTQVLVFKQSRLVQFGGARTSSTIVEQPFLENVRFFHAFQGLCLDDVTGLRTRNCFFGGIQQKISLGYNINGCTFYDLYSGGDNPTITATCTNGSNVIAVTANGYTLYVGAKVHESANADGTLNFPEHTYVTAINGSNVTLSNPYGGTTASRTLFVSDGALLVGGKGGSAFLGACSSNTLANMISNKVVGGVAGRIDRLVDFGDGVGYGNSIDTFYAESCQRLVTSGRAGGTANSGWKIDVTVQGADAMAGPPVEDFLAATGTPWDVKVVGSGTSKFPLIQTRAYNASIVLRQGWSWTNNSTVAKSYGQVSPAIVNLATVDVNTSMAIAQGAEWSFNTGNFGRVDGKGATITNGAFSGNLNWNWPGISCLDLTLAGNLTAGSIIYGMPTKGYVLDMILKQDATGTRTVTLGSSFVTGAGAAVSITGSAAAAVCIMKFVSDGVHLVLQGNQSPAFI